MTKINNDDVRKITVIKQWLLDPPVSFKLYDHAVNNLKDVLAILSKYPSANNTLGYFNELMHQLENKTISKENLSGELKKAGINISKLTSK